MNAFTAAITLQQYTKPSWYSSWILMFYVVIQYLVFAKEVDLIFPYEMETFVSETENSQIFIEWMFYTVHEKFRMLTELATF